MTGVQTCALPIFVSGVDALGRTNEAQRLQMVVQTVSQLLGPPAVASFIDPSEFITRLAVSYDIDPKALVRSKEEVQAQQQQAQMQDMAGKLGPHVIKAAADQQQQMAAPPTQ